MPTQTEHPPVTWNTFLAKKLPNMRTIKAWFTGLTPATRLKINDRIARDIGLSQHDLAVMRHQWPSETQRHPYL